MRASVVRKTFRRTVLLGQALSFVAEVSFLFTPGHPSPPISRHASSAFFSPSTNVAFLKANSSWSRAASVFQTRSRAEVHGGGKKGGSQGWGREKEKRFHMQRGNGPPLKPGRQGSCCCPAAHPGEPPDEPGGSVPGQSLPPNVCISPNHTGR